MNTPLLAKSLTARQRLWTFRLSLAFVVYSLVGFLVLPAIIKWQLVKQLPPLTKRSAAVRQVRLNPWTLSLTIRGLRLTEPDGQPFASFEEFYANFQLSSLFRRAWTFKEVRLTDPQGAVILQKNGQLNFANLMESTPAAPAPKAAASADLPRANIFLLSITNGLVTIEDKTRHAPFRTEYRPINIVLKDLTTRPGTGTPYSFRAENDTGKVLDWAGDITLQPLSSRGRIEVKNAEPKKYQPYLEDFTRAQIIGGRMDIRGDYFFASGTNGLDLNITNGGVQLTGFKVSDPDANETILSVPDLTLQGLRFNLRERQADADALKIDGTEILTRLNPDGSLNLLRLLLPPSTNPVPAPAQSSAPWTATLGDFELTKSSVTFEDRSRPTPFQTRLHPLDLAFRNFTTRPGTAGAYKFSVATEASEKITGAGTASINPVRSTGEISLESVEIKKYWPYLQSFLRGEIASGQVDLKLAYQTALATNGLTASASNTVLRLTNLALKSPDRSETVLSIPEFSVEGGRADLSEQTATINRVTSSGGSILARREAGGAINLLSLLAPPPKTEGATNSVPEKPTKPWTASIEEIGLENYSINLEDKVPAHPSTVQLDQIAVNLKGVSSAAGSTVATRFAVRVNQSASVVASGTLTPTPLSAQLNLVVTNLDLRMLQPYLEPYTSLELSSGKFNLASRVAWTQAPTNSGHLQFAGGFSITGFGTTLQPSAQEFVKWTNLTVEGIKLEMPPESLHVESIQWDGLTAHVLIDSNKQPNLASVLVHSTNAPVVGVQDSAPKTPREPGESRLPLALSVQRFALTNAGVFFADASIQPAATLEIKHVGGTVTGLASDANATAEVDLSGSIGDQSPFTLGGRINPLASEPHLNLTLSNRNMQLAPLTPYLEKYAGHPLNKGRLSMSLHYEVAGKELKSANHVQIDQLSLGPRNDSPDATKLPVKLGVALLKDSSGQILLDVPVNGRLDDPQFRIGPIVLKVVVNLITKAVASPFKLLGAAVGGGEELSFLEFLPGSAQFVEGETNKLGKLVKALSERALSLEIEPAVDPQRDRLALARQTVQAEIKSIRLQELSSTGQTPPEPAAFAVESGEKSRLLRAAVMDRFGTNFTQAIQEMMAAATNTPAANSADRSEARSTKWYQVWKIPFEKKNSPAAAARRQAKADAELLKQNPALAALTEETMENLLATHLEVPSEQFLQLMKERTEATRAELLKAGLGEDRVLLVAPKPLKEGYRGESRVNLSLN